MGPAATAHTAGVRLRSWRIMRCACWAWRAMSSTTPCSTQHVCFWAASPVGQLRVRGQVHPLPWQCLPRTPASNQRVQKLASVWTQQAASQHPSLPACRPGTPAAAQSARPAPPAAWPAAGAAGRGAVPACRMTPHPPAQAALQARWPWCAAATAPLPAGPAGGSSKEGLMEGCLAEGAATGGGGTAEGGGAAERRPCYLQRRPALHVRLHFAIQLPQLLQHLAAGHGMPKVAMAAVNFGADRRPGVDRRPRGRQVCACRWDDHHHEQRRLVGGPSCCDWRGRAISDGVAGSTESGR